MLPFTVCPPLFSPPFTVEGGRYNCALLLVAGEGLGMGVSNAQLCDAAKCWGGGVTRPG